jgi:hypothetical protein
MAAPSVLETGNISWQWLSFLPSQILIELELSQEVNSWQGLPVASKLIRYGLWQSFSVIQSLVLRYEVHLDSTENINKRSPCAPSSYYVCQNEIHYCIVKEWKVCYLKYFLYFTDICSLYSLWGRKSFHLATVKLCTSCSQTADRKAWSLKSEMKFYFCW